MKQLNGKAWDEVKKVLTTQPVLSLQDSNKEHVLMTDASDHFIGGASMQREDDGCTLAENV